MEQYGLTDRASDLRDSCCAAVAAVELPWADFVGPHVPASLQNNMEATSTTRYVRGVIETVHKSICDGCRRPPTILGDIWEHLTAPAVALQAWRGEYGPHVRHIATRNPPLI